MIVTSILSAMQAGKELANAETWKKRQVLTSAIFTLLTGVAGIALSLGFQIPLISDSAGLEGVASLLGMALYGLFQLWATFATTKRIGLPARSGAGLSGPTDGSGHDPDAERDATKQPSDDGRNTLLDMSQRG